MADKDYLQHLHEMRQKAWHEAKGIMDHAASENRNLTGEETEQLERTNKDIDGFDQTIKSTIEMNERAAAADKAREAYAPFITPDQEQSRSEQSAASFVEFLRTGQGGDAKGGWDVDMTLAVRESDAIRRGAGEAELRALLSDTGSSGSLIPTDFARTLYQYMVNGSSVRQLARVITTSTGANMDFPNVATHGIGTQVIAQGTAVGGTDPVFGKITLGAFKYGQLVPVSSEMIQDSAVDITGFIAENIGRAIGVITATAYTTGAGGAGAPLGVVTACTGSIVTGGSLITPTIENYIDLQYSVAGPYRANGAYLVNDLTAGTVRKFRSDLGGTSGQFLWEPSPIMGQPDRLFGRPIYTETNMATHGSNSRVAVFGDFSAYYIRDAGGVRIERSDDYLFNVDEVAFRGILRTDADLIDANAVKCLIQRVS
jgi:HK97 family phage major capsid protein